MIEEPAKPFLSNIAVSDMFVPVDVGPKWSFGIVGVDHLDVIDAEMPRARSSSATVFLAPAADATSKPEAWPDPQTRCYQGRESRPDRTRPFLSPGMQRPQASQ